MLTVRAEWCKETIRMAFVVIAIKYGVTVPALVFSPVHLDRIAIEFLKFYDHPMLGS